MQRIRIGRYSNPEEIGYQGWIETDEWIIWISNDGTLTIGTDREDDGSVHTLTVVEV